MKIGYLMQASVADIRKIPYDGPSVHVRQVFYELQQLGHEVHLLAEFDKQLFQSAKLESFQPVSVPWLDKGPLRWIESTIRRVQYELRLPYIAFFASTRFCMACYRAFRGYDFLYERMGWMGYGGVLASLCLGIPLILEVNGDFVAEFEMLGVAAHGVQKWLEMFIMQRAIHRAAHIITAGEGWRASFIQRWQVDPAKVTSIENGSELVDLLQREQLHSFQPVTDPDKPITMAYLGGFHPWQGVTILINAFAKAIAQGLQARLLLIGSGANKGETEELVRNLKLEANVTFMGHMPAHEFAHHLAAADIAVSCYCGREEYSGLKLLDYKAAGCAIIASGKDNQPVILKHGETAWIVPPCDDSALAQAMLHLSTNTALRRQLGQAARLDAELSHSWRHTAEQIVELVEQLRHKKQV